MLKLVRCRNLPDRQTDSHSNLFYPQNYPCFLYLELDRTALFLNHVFNQHQPRIIVLGLIGDCAIIICEGHLFSSTMKLILTLCIVKRIYEQLLLPVTQG